MAKGENIFRRRDGRWEARYIKGRAIRKNQVWILLWKNISGSQRESRKAQSSFGKWSSLTDSQNAKTVLQLLLGMATYKEMHGERIDVY